MADKNFTEFPAVASATLADILLAVQGGVNVQVTQAQVLSLFQDNIVLAYSGDPNGNVAGYIYQLIIDIVNNDFYVCTTTGSAGTTVWTLVGSNLLRPANGGTGVSSPTANTLPVANGSSAFSFLGPLTDGQLTIGSTGVAPVVATITAGIGMTIVNAPGSITLNATGSPFAWTDVTGTSQALAINNGYISNNAGLVTLTLPSSAPIGSRIEIIGLGAGKWKIAQNALQCIRIGANSSTIGVTGSVSATNQNDSLALTCVATDLEWSILGAPQGNLTVV